MRKNVIALSICCAAILSLIVWRAFYPSGTASATSPAAEQTETPLYLVRAQPDGTLAIYPYGSSTASEVTDIQLTSLREYDQSLILHGFPLYSEEDLTCFLEDFGS